jgi:ribosomal protein L7/L12
MDLKGMNKTQLQELGSNVSAELLKLEDPQLFHMVGKEYLNGRIQAIKMVRGALGNGLKEAKGIVDYWANSSKWFVFPKPKQFRL